MKTVQAQQTAIFNCYGADRDLQLLRRYADLDDADLEEAFRHFLDPQ